MTTISLPRSGDTATSARSGGLVRLVDVARLVALKDLAIERRARVTTTQLVPFGLLALVLFALALDPDRNVLPASAPGVFWTVVILSVAPATTRAFDLEREGGTWDRLRAGRLDPRGLFLGKVAASVIQLSALEVVLLVGLTVLYGIRLASPLLLLAVAVLATLGLVVVATVYGVLVAGLRSRATTLPVLLLPVVTPVLLAGTRGWEAALGDSPAEGWPWVALLGAFAATYLAVGLLVFGPLFEEG